MKSKPALLAHLRECGMEPDLRQEDRSFAFATFPVSDSEISGGEELGFICRRLKDHFIHATVGKRFASRSKQLTFCPVVSTLIPQPKTAIELSYRSGGHIFARCHLDESQWPLLSNMKRFALIQLGVVSCIEAVRPAWLTENDRSDLMSVFLSSGAS